MAVDFGDRPVMTIPVPMVSPLGLPVNTRAGVQEVWDALVLPDMESNFIQSVEMRVLIAILRAVYEGMES